MATPKQRANNLEVEEAHAKFQENRATQWNSRFQQAEDFRKSRQAKAGKRKAKKETKGIEKLTEDVDDFEIRFAKDREEIDRHIPLQDKEMPLKVSKNGVNTKNPLMNKKSEKDQNDELESSKSSGSSALVPHEPVSRVKGENCCSGELPEENLQVLQPVPIKINKFEDLKLASVEARSAPSLHTGAQLHVNRVPTERIPPTPGLSVMGLHPHASSWTRSPQWAQTTVAFGMGAALAGLGFGVYKFLQKFIFGTAFMRPKGIRSHARDWNVEANEGEMGPRNE